MSSIPTRPASTVVLLRPADPFEVFLVRRSDSIAFMGGAHVFPGGRVDEDDRLHDIDALSVGAEAAAARMSDVPRDVAIAHHVAAVRELFEEAGVLLARPLDTAWMPTLEQYRRDLLTGAIAFADIVRREHFHLALDELAYFAHWVTPEIETRRFDTRFFIARARRVTANGLRHSPPSSNAVEGSFRCRRQRGRRLACCRGLARSKR